jgi:hypothetical protein
VKWHFLFLAYRWRKGNRGFVIFCLLGLAFLLYTVAQLR